MVQFASKLPFGDAAPRDGIGIDVVRMREERAARAKQALKKEGIPTLLVTGENNVRYLTGFTWGEYQPQAGYTLFFAEHDPVIFAPGGSYQMAPELMTWIKHWRIGRNWLQGMPGVEASREEAALFAKEIHQELQERGLAKEKVGIIGFDDLARESLKALGVNLVDATQLLFEVSAIKTVDEINCLKMVASMCQVGLQLVRDKVKPGMTEREVGLDLVDAMARAGSETPRSRVWSGPNSFERTLTPFPRRIEWGDIMYVNVCGNSYMGYMSCIYRTYKLGRKPTEKEKGWYDKVKERIDRAIEVTRVGKTTADAAKAFDPASRWGYKDEA